jgi:HK97 gp10 family phage protein
MMELKVYGHQQLMVELAEIHSHLGPEVVEGLDEVADKIVKDARELCPVDTGALQRSIRKEKELRSLYPFTYTIGVAAGGHVKNPKTGRKVDYAAHVEFGTSRTPAQPFMGPAIEKNRAEIRRILSKKVLEALE